MLIMLCHIAVKGGGAFFLIQNLIFCFVFDDLHLQIIAIISPKASVENSSAQWAIFFYWTCCLYNKTMEDVILLKASGENVLAQWAIIFMQWF